MLVSFSRGGSKGGFQTSRGDGGLLPLYGGTFIQSYSVLSGAV